MTVNATDTLGDLAAEVAARAAAQFCVQHCLVTTGRTEELIAAIRRHAAKALPIAMDNAKLAIDANMPKQAELLFRLEFALAGANAAKEVFGIE